MPKAAIAAALVLTSLAACGESSNGVYRNLTGDQSCPGLSPVAQQYVFATPDLPARCGPQVQSPH